MLLRLTLSTHPQRVGKNGGELAGEMSVRIEIGVEEHGGEARFSVKDNGVGIPDDKLEVIFERFWQVGKNDRRGLGLGLYISKCLVAAHGGEIWAESELGVGSAFYFTLPGARAASAR